METPKDQPALEQSALPQHIDTLVIGAGQAGLAMSAHLTDHGISHLVLERHRIAERWRTERWDSLVANGPAWHDRFPAMEFDGIDPDAFASKDDVVDYFASFAQSIQAPVRCGVTVTDMRPADAGFLVTTSAGSITAQNVVSATGAFHRPVFPKMVPDDAGVMQIHSNRYRNPDQLPPGAVMVVGAGSSGTQIAEELMLSGRQVYLSIGPHDRPPRRYRGVDFVWWLGVLGKWEQKTPSPDKEHTTIAVSGARGGHTVDFRRLAAGGMTLTGRTQRFADGVLHFAPDLARNIANGDANHLEMLAEADAYAQREGLDLPPEPEAHVIPPDPPCVTDPLLRLDLAEAGVSTIIWATGYRFDFDWLSMDILDEQGKPRHRRGVTEVPGLYVLGLPWLSRRASSFIWGVWNDAKYLADHIAAARGVPVTNSVSDRSPQA